MKISVIIPAYNEEKYIGACLQSLIDQQEKPDEVIVVDNNCIDKTVEIATKYQAKIVPEKTQGMIPARNAGLNAASYEIIARGDADTIYPPDWIKKIKKHFEESDAVAVSGPGAFAGLPFWAVTIYFYISKFALGHAILFGANFAVKKSVWTKIRNLVCMNDKEVHEDIDLAIHISPYGKILYDPSLLVKASSRRLKNNPTSFFIEYPKRWINTIFFQKHLREKP